MKELRVLGASNSPKRVNRFRLIIFTHARHSMPPHIRRNNMKRMSLALCIYNLVINQTEGLQIGPLLSTCVDACQRGCAEIRSVQESRLKLGDKSLKVYLKALESLGFA